jgi:hypothetical protein
MLLHKVLRQVVSIAQPIVKKLETQVKAWTKPATDSLVGGMAADLVKSQEQLIVENALLRQQVIVLKRQVARPQLTAKDRSLLVVLASRVKDWKNAVLMVKPETVLRWHREGFKLFWRRKSKGKARQPRISEETIALIKQMAVDNRRWGAKRIRGELLKLGMRVNKGTIRRICGRHDASYLHNIMAKVGRPFWPIMRRKSGRVISCRPTTCSSARSLSSSSLSWNRGGWSILASHDHPVMPGSHSSGAMPHRLRMAPGS